MREAFRIFWSSHLMTLLRRVAIVYLVLMICRIILVVYNLDIIEPIGWSEIPQLLSGAFLFDSSSYGYGFMPFTLLSIIPFRFREKRWYQRMLYWIFMVLVSLFAAINLIDALYFHYTGMRITSADLIFAKNDNNIALFFTFFVENWYLFIAWVGLIIGSHYLYKWSGEPKSAISNNVAYYSVNTLMFLVLGFLCFLMARGTGFNRSSRPIHLSGAARYVNHYTKSSIVLSNPYCIIRTVGEDHDRLDGFFDEQVLRSIYTPYHYPELSVVPAAVWGGEVVGVDEDKIRRTEFGYLPKEAWSGNIVIFLMESFSAESSALLNPGLYENEMGYTPFLDSLMRNGYYFERAYSSGRKSIDALPAIISSMPSIRKPFITMPESLGAGMQMPKILSDQGYVTQFMCASPPGSMGFEAYMRLSGVEQIYDSSHYDQRNPGNDDYDGKWGVWDEPFLQFAGQIMGETHQPFFTTLFTISSHHPFLVPEEYQELLPEGITKIHKPTAYSDMAFRKFFERYSSEEWFENTLFFFCADHRSSEVFAPEHKTAVGQHHIISFIYTPSGMIRGVDSRTFEQTDIMPTILGLKHYKQPYFAFGSDVFNEDERFAIGYNGGVFQLITDSLVIHFNGEELVAAYTVEDRLFEHNIADPTDPKQQQALDYLKAYLQQYYEHIARREFLAPRP